MLDDRVLSATPSGLSGEDGPFLALKNGEYVVLETVRTAGGGCHCERLREGSFSVSFSSLLWRAWPAAWSTLSNRLSTLPARAPIHFDITCYWRVSTVGILQIYWHDASLSINHKKIYDKIPNTTLSLTCESGCAHAQQMALCLHFGCKQSNVLYRVVFVCANRQKNACRWVNKVRYWFAWC